MLAPLQMAETGFATSEANANRLAEPFAADPWTGDKVALFNMLEQPVMESGGGGLVSTTMDYARFALMLRNGGTLDGNRIIGRKTLELMASDHLGPEVKTNGTLLSPGHGFGLGFAVRREAGMAPTPGTVGEYFWGGIAGTAFWIAPKEELIALMMIQAPGQRDHYRQLFRFLIHVHAKLPGVFDRLAVQRENDVLRLNSGRSGCPAGHDVRHNRAHLDRQGERRSHIGIDGLDKEAHLSAPDPAILADLFVDGSHDRAGGGKSDALVSARSGQDERIDPDDVAVSIEQRPAAITRVDGSVGLDVNHRIVGPDLPRHGADDTHGH